MTLIASDAHFPSPQQSPDEITAYFRENAGRVAVCAFLQFSAAIPLGLVQAKAGRA